MIIIYWILRCKESQAFIQQLLSIIYLTYHSLCMDLHAVQRLSIIHCKEKFGKINNNSKTCQNSCIKFLKTKQFGLTRADKESKLKTGSYTWPWTCKVWGPACKSWLSSSLPRSWFSNVNLKWAMTEIITPCKLGSFVPRKLVLRHLPVHHWIYVTCCLK